MDYLLVCRAYDPKHSFSKTNMWRTHLLASHINRLECYFHLNSELNFDLFVIISQVSIVSKPIGDVILIVVISDDYLVITSSTNKHKTFQCNFHSFHFHRLPRRLSFKNITYKFALVPHVKTSGNIV